MSVAWVSMDAVDDGEGELSLCEVFCEAFVLGVLRDTRALVEKVWQYEVSILLLCFEGS